MPSKNNTKGDKKKGKEAADAGDKGKGGGKGGLKAATSVNTRHILVRT